jgi:hypothetical protein
MDELHVSKYGVQQHRTEEVAAIIEKMPMRFSLYVSLIILLIAACLVFFGWTIKYPDLVKGQISISAPQSPVKLVAAVSGKMDIMAPPGDSVKAGAYLAVIKNPAVTTDVVLVDSLLNRINIYRPDYGIRRSFFPEKVSLGELNNKYFAFLTALYQYLDYYHTDPIGQQEKITQSLLEENRQLLATANDQSGILERKYRLAERDFKRDSNLFANQVIDRSDIDKSNLNLINYEQEAKAISKDIYSDKYQMEEASNKLQQLAVQRIDKERELRVGLFNSYFELKESIRQWEKTYVFIAPFDGKIDYLNFWKSGDYVSSGKEVFSVIPPGKEVFGQVYLPETGAGKVQVGQDVIIKLNNSPYEEYGIMKGQVRSMSLVTNQQVDGNSQNKSDVFLVTVGLPGGLTTNYGRPLHFYFDAKGSAEIVTRDRRLYERLFDNLKYRVKQ